jgi:hypothetical protein
MFQNTQLINGTDYDVKNMIFSEPAHGSIPDSKPAISFQRVNIMTRNSDGSVGELIIPTGKLFSFGVSENTSQETGKTNGYTMPLCMWSKHGATQEEKAWTDTFDKIVEKCIDYILDNKEEIDKFDLDRSDLKKFNPLYWKKEKVMIDGKPRLEVAKGTGPTLYTKLIFSKRSDKFVTKFYDHHDNPIDPFDLVGKYCYTYGAVKIESIFIGNKISLQVKLYEAVVEPLQTGSKRLLTRPESNSVVLNSQSNVMNMTGKSEEEEEDDDDESSSDGSIEAEEPIPTKPTKKVVRRVTKK